LLVDMAAAPSCSPKTWQRSFAIFQQRDGRGDQRPPGWMKKVMAEKERVQMEAANFSVGRRQPIWWPAAELFSHG
jgi:hypothetical protein